MPRREWVEMLIMILVLVAWWPYIFYPYFPAWFGFAQAAAYRGFLFFGTPIPLLVILVLRVRRYRQALREAEEIAEQRARVDSDRKLR